MRPAPPPLAIQEYLRAVGSPDSLAAELGILSYRHPTLPLVGFKYSQLGSPKRHPVVRDARGIVLEEGTWDVVALPFRRFFNAGEDPDDLARFRWDDCTATTKEDGSLILVYHYAGGWHVNTSGSFGLGVCGSSGRTWRDLFWATAPLDRDRLDPELTYLFEFWTRHNKVVRAYPAPTAFLLSAFDREQLAELTVAEADAWAARLAVARPAHHHFDSLDAVLRFLAEHSARDRTFEGFVLRDARGERLKVKSTTYVELHHLLANENLAHPRRLVPLILAGEVDEVLSYFPEFRPEADEVIRTLERDYAELVALWRATRAIPNQADFARAVVGRSPYANLLFQVRKNHGADQTEADLAALWRQSADLILKTLARRGQGEP